MRRWWWWCHVVRSGHRQDKHKKQVKSSKEVISGGISGDIIDRIHHMGRIRDVKRKRDQKDDRSGGVWKVGGRRVSSKPMYLCGTPDDSGDTRQDTVRITRTDDGCQGYQPESQ